MTFKKVGSKMGIVRRLISSSLDISRTVRSIPTPVFRAMEDAMRKPFRFRFVLRLGRFALEIEVVDLARRCHLR